MAGQNKLERATVKWKCGVNGCGKEVENLAVHNRTNHVYSNTCLICLTDLENVVSLLTHYKMQHWHMLGYLRPESSMVAEMDSHEHPVNQAVILQEIESLQISSLGGTWIVNDDYGVAYDLDKMRPLVTVEIVTPQTLDVVYSEVQADFPYLQDRALPAEQPAVTNIRKTDTHVSHLATSANHRLTKEKNDSTYLLRNLVRLYANVNRGILKSVETHLTQLGRTWWRSIIVTVPLYDDSQSFTDRLPEPTDVAKMMILGDTQLQCFIIRNSVDTDPNAANFVAMRVTLTEFNEATHLNFHSTLPMSWAFPMWKCDKCRFMRDDKLELGLHVRFEHQDGYCPVCRKHHGELYPDFDSYKQHVEDELEKRGKKHCTVEGCTKWFYNIPLRSKHVKEVHIDKSHQCTAEGCDKSFKTPKQLARHVKTHDGNRQKWQCDLCPLTFKVKAHLQAHIRLHHRQASTTSPTRVCVRRPIRSLSQPEDDPSPDGQVAALTQENALLREQLAQRDLQIGLLRAQLSQRDDENALLREQLGQSKRNNEPQPSTSSACSLAKKKRRK